LFEREKKGHMWKEIGNEEFYWKTYPKQARETNMNAEAARKRKIGGGPGATADVHPVFQLEREPTRFCTRARPKINQKQRGEEEESFLIREGSRILLF